MEADAKMVVAVAEEEDAEGAEVGEDVGEDEAEETGITALLKQRIRSYLQYVCII